MNSRNQFKIKKSEWQEDTERRIHGLEQELSQIYDFLKRLAALNSKKQDKVNEN